MKMRAAARRRLCSLGPERISAQDTPSESAAGGLLAQAQRFEPAAGGFEGRVIVWAISYFSFRSNVARTRGKNSCSTGQNWSRTSTTCPKSRQNLYQLRQTSSVQVLPAQAESLSSVGPAREVGVQRNAYRDVGLDPQPSHETKARRMGHPENPM